MLLRRTPGTFYVLTYHRGPAPLNTAPRHIIKNVAKIPAALSCVSWLFLLVGIAGCVGTVIEILHGSVHVYLELLGLPIFFGLRRLSRGWRLCALVSLCLSAVVLFGCILTPRFLHSPTRIRYLGFDFPMVPPWLPEAIGALLLPLVLWQFRVLTRAETRALFSPFHATKVA